MAASTVLGITRLNTTCRGFEACRSASLGVAHEFCQRTADPWLVSGHLSGGQACYQAALSAKASMGRKTEVLFDRLNSRAGAHPGDIYSSYDGRGRQDDICHCGRATTSPHRTAIHWCRY